MQLLWAALVLSGTLMAVEGAEIAFKYVEDYEWIWDDGGSGASKDVSIWRPIDFQSGYYPVGDVAVSSHSKPEVPALTVKALESGTLKKPYDFTRIWTDVGSGADDDVAVYRMNPYSGYTCIGDVAVGHHSDLPDKNKYRCLKTEYVIDGKYEPIWRDSGSGANDDVGLWANTNIGVLQGIDANAFTSLGNHNTPTGTPSILDSDHAKHYTLIPIDKTYPLTAYEGTDMDKIWTDSGSGANKDFSVWRPKGPSGYYSVGDIPYGSHNQPPLSVIVKARISDALEPPYFYRKRWDDSGSGANKDCSFWEPGCPSGYRALGHRANNDKNQAPPTEDFRCVKAEYTVTGAWQWVWNDKGSGADDDVSVYQAVPSGSNGQGVVAMGTVDRHGSMDRTAYVLKASETDYIIGKPAQKYLITNLEYLYDDRLLLSEDPEQLARTVVENQGDTEVTSTRIIGYSYTETYEWSHEVGLEIGVETEISTGIPVLAEGSVTVTITTSYTYTTGGSVEESKEDSIEVEVTVQPHSQKSVTVTSNRYVMDLPYTCTLTTLYADGSTGVRDNYKGTYEGVQINEVRVVYEEDIPLSSK